MLAKARSLGCASSASNGTQKASDGQHARPHLAPILSLLAPLTEQECARVTARRFATFAHATPKSLFRKRHRTISIILCVCCDTRTAFVKHSLWSGAKTVECCVPPASRRRPAAGRVTFGIASAGVVQCGVRCSGLIITSSVLSLTLDSRLAAA